MLIAHITDPHVRGPGELMGGRIPTDSRLIAAVRSINAGDPHPDLVIATGDLVNDGDRPGGAPQQYARLAEILSELRPPLLVIPGNHDDRAQMRTHLAAHLPAGTLGPSVAPDSPLTYAVEEYPVRILALDTSVPRHPHGELGEQQLRWLADTLSAQPDRPTILLMHHPPFATGIAHMDQMGLSDPGALEAVVAAHPQVIGILCGHLHRSITSRFAHTVALTAPSTAASIALRLNGERYRYSSEPPAMAMHLWDARSPMRLSSHVVSVDEGEAWLPDWAQRLELDHESTADATGLEQRMGS